MGYLSGTATVQDIANFTAPAWEPMRYLKNGANNSAYTLKRGSSKVLEPLTFLYLFCYNTFTLVSKFS